MRPDAPATALLGRLHDDPAAGHLDIAKTMARIAQLYYWPEMFRDIARYVRACTTCMAHKASQQRPAGNLQATPVIAPWQQVSIDLVGPAPTLKSWPPGCSPYRTVSPNGSRSRHSKEP
ncbi:hypothetical protein RF55_11997 [Lasius niger]|uniref:Integrase zinc-binding domain-containing protein n=1 Tax=Lasius niger TaxID=67767 RepID=A0A0J7KE84_LASNI|nr:hypothetical protein RF55_11997 [Lasius niger]